MIKGEDMKEEMGGVIHTIDSIVVLANRVWMRKRAAKIMTNLPHLIFPGTRAVSLVPPPKTPELHLSLVYDIIRGNIAGSANSHMDVALEISHDYPASGVYLDAIETLVPQHAAIQRIADKKRKAVPISRGVCKLSGCTVNVHPRFWRQKLCYRHGGQQEKLCKKCFIRCGKGGGGCAVHAMTYQKMNSAIYVWSVGGPSLEGYVIYALWGLTGQGRRNNGYIPKVFELVKNGAVMVCTIPR